MLKRADIDDRFILDLYCNSVGTPSMFCYHCKNKDAMFMLSMLHHTKCRRHFGQNHFRSDYLESPMTERNLIGSL